MKICGLTDVQQALKIAGMGADAIGVIGVSGTPRFVADQARHELFQTLESEAPTVQRVWVVANPDDVTLSNAFRVRGAPTVVQLHGNESAERCYELKQRHPCMQWWKALRIRTQDDLRQLRVYSSCVDALLLDAWSPDQLGGTGHRLPLEWLTETALSLPWWLAGGISAEWIPELMAKVQPHGLDASSRLEERPGWKDLSKVEALLKAVQSSGR